MPSKDKLVLGCGENFLGDDWTHLDISNLSHVDVVHDLESGELPFEDDRFQRIRARHVLEHLTEDKAVEIVEEIARVGRPGAEVRIVLPHFLSWNSQDLDHYWSGSRRTFVQFCEGYGMNSPYSSVFVEREVIYRLEHGFVYSVLDKFVSRKSIAQYIPNSVREICFVFEVKNQ